MVSARAAVILALAVRGSVNSFSVSTCARVGAGRTTTSRLKSIESVLASKRDDGDVPEYLPTSFGMDAVPEGQRPVNEFTDLMRAPLFGWASEERGTNGLLFRLVATYVVTFAAVCYPISGATFTQEGFELQKLAASNVGALMLIMLLLLRLYSGWGYVGSRLNSKVVEYEETGWYDGSSEEKSDIVRQRDQFLYQSSVKPVIDRLKLVSLVTSGLFVAACFGFNASMSIRPIFNEYDPRILERVRYDDKLSDIAAKESNGRPTYCDSRYYRAIAGGGQGCD